jgi:RHS repeat-associated protein
VKNAHFQAISAYPFGMTMPDRHKSDYAPYSMDYRYAYNGMEVDNEVSGDGNSYTTEFRQYDPRLGRWKSLDPLMFMFPSMSPYCAFDNNPVVFIDPFGLASEGGLGDPPSRYKQGTNEERDWVEGDTYLGENEDGTFTEYTYHDRPGARPDRWSSKTVKVKDPVYVYADSKATQEQKFNEGIVFLHEQGFLQTNNSAGPKYEVVPGTTKDVSPQATSLAGAIPIASTGGLFGTFAFSAYCIWWLHENEDITATISEIREIDLSLDDTDAIPITIPHANSKDNPNPHIVYELYAIGLDGSYQTLKYGIADEKFGTFAGEFNSRPTSQLPSAQGDDIAVGLIVRQRILVRTPDRQTALSFEAFLVQGYRITHNGSRPPLQKLP